MKRVALTVVLMLAALLVLGVGFARWFDVLTIDGEVNTGEVIAELTADQPVIKYDDDKDVSTVTRELSDTDQDGYNDQMTVTIENAYPEVGYWIPFDVHSWGDVPIHVKPYLDEWDYSLGHLSLGYSGGGTPAPGDEFSWVQWVQLHYSETADYAVYVRLHDTAPEGSTLSFAYSLDCGQYNEPNEDPTP